MSDSHKAAMYFGKGSNSKAAHDLMKSNPAEYKRLKEVALADGRLARSEHLNPNIRDRWNPRQFSQEELTLLAEVPESETAKYFGSESEHNAAATLQEMAQTDNPRYQRLRQAAQLRGKIETCPSQPAPQPRAVSQFVTVSDADCDAAGLPRNYQTTASGLETIQRVTKEVSEKKIAADALAAKTAAQLERDRKADESAAEFGRLLDLNREMAAKKAA